MDKKFKIYLLFCIVMFFVLLFVVLLYSFGYRYDIKNGKTIKTGAIVIKTIPKNADIYLNGELLKIHKTIDELFNDYIKIKGLNSGVYDIEVKKDGYFSWKKSIRVKGGYITEAKNIVLLKSKYKENVLLDSARSNLSLAHNLWPSSKKDKIAYAATKEDKTTLFVLDLKTKNRKIVFNPYESPIEESGNEYSFDNVIWSGDDTKIILRLKNGGRSFWFLIDLGNKNKIYNLGDIFEESQEVKNEWNLYFGGSSLFYIKSNVLYEFDYKTLLIKKILENISGFLVEGNNIYYLKTTDNSLHLITFGNLFSDRIVFTMPDDFDPKLPSRIAKSGENTFLILSASGRLYFADDRGKISLINSSVRDAYFSNNDTRVIYYNSHEIWIYYIKEKKSQPFKKEATNELITRYSGNITNVFLYKDEEHLFYKEGEIFKFAELDNRDNVNIFDLLKLNNNSIFYSKELNSLFFAEDSRIVQINLDEK